MHLQVLNYNQTLTLKLGRKIPKGLILKEFGECVGICMHHQTSDEIAEEMALAQMEENPKKKKEDVLKEIKKQISPDDQTRVLIFKDGMGVSSAD